MWRRLLLKRDALHILLAEKVLFLHRKLAMHIDLVALIFPSNFGIRIISEIGAFIDKAFAFIIDKDAKRIA